MEKIETVQCKFTGSKDKVINFRSTGGTKGTVYDNILNHPLDWLFCADDELNMFFIPMEEIRKSGNQKQIILRTQRSLYANSKYFDSSKYLVKMGEQRD